MTNPLSENSIPLEEDAISIKKCLVGLNQKYIERTRERAEQKFQNSPLKKLGLFLAKIMKTYPFAH